MIDAYKKAYLAAVELAEARFVYGLQKTLDDQLAVPVGEKGSSPLKIAGRLAGFTSFIAFAIANKSFPPRDGAVPEPPATREAAIAAVEQGYAALKEAVAGLQEADFEAEIPAPWGSKFGVLQWLNMTNGVLGYWQGQLNLAQLAYGDEDPNIPPSWTAPAG